MKERLEKIKFLEVTTSMLPYGIPFPVVPESTEVMNIIVPEMLQNALTETMTVEEAANDAAERINELIASPLARRVVMRECGRVGYPTRPASHSRRRSDRQPMAIAEAPALAPPARAIAAPHARDAGAPRQPALGGLSLRAAVAAGDAGRHRLSPGLHHLAVVSRHAAADRASGSSTASENYQDDS